MTISPSRTQRSGRAARSGVGELREVAVERLEVARLDVDLVAVAEDERPEAVPLRLEQPAVALGQAVDGLGEHRLDRRLEREGAVAIARVYAGPPGHGKRVVERRPRPFPAEVPGERAE